MAFDYNNYAATNNQNEILLADSTVEETKFKYDRN